MAAGVGRCPRSQMGGQINAKRVSFFFQLLIEQHFPQDRDLRCWGGHASQKMGKWGGKKREGKKWGRTPASTLTLSYPKFGRESDRTPAQLHYWVELICTNNGYGAASFKGVHSKPLEGSYGRLLWKALEGSLLLPSLFWLPVMNGPETRALAKPHARECCSLQWWGMGNSPTSDIGSSPFSETQSRQTIQLSELQCPNLGKEGRRGKRWE